MKRWVAILLVVALALAMAGCGANSKKNDIFKLVEKKYDTILKACEERDQPALLAIDGVEKIKVTDNYVIVYCGGKGCAPSSQDYGFYYSADGSMIGVDCNMDIVCRQDSLQPEGDGFQAVVDHNTFYTQQIKGNLYFYSNAY